MPFYLPHSYVVLELPAGSPAARQAQILAQAVSTLPQQTRQAIDARDNLFVFKDLALDLKRNEEKADLSLSALKLKVPQIQLRLTESETQSNDQVYAHKAFPALYQHPDDHSSLGAASQFLMVSPISYQGQYSQPEGSVRLSPELAGEAQLARLDGELSITPKLIFALPPVATEVPATFDVGHAFPVRASQVALMDALLNKKQQPGSTRFNL